MNFVFASLAQQEYDDAVNWYEGQMRGLGERFRIEVENGLARIEAHPQAWPLERGEVRKYLLNRFPYKLLYAIEPARAVILAVAHQHRRPDYWVDRSA
jgi:plasmid stabilization system protein ParE